MGVGFEMAEMEEDWFHDSIKRYKNLNMFVLEYPVQHMEQTTANSICVSCTNQKRHQLLELSLPLKLISQRNSTHQPVITSDTDMKIKCGTFTRLMVTHMKATKNERKLVASHFKTYGVALYNFSDDSDEIKKEYVIKCELESPSLALSGTELFLTKNTACPTLVMDLNTGQIIRKVVCEESSTGDELLTPVLLDSQQLALSNQTTGCVLLYDTRDFKLLSKISAQAEKNTMWSFCSQYGCSEKSSCSIQSSYFAMVSSCGKLNIYDSRNWNSPCISEHLGFSAQNESRVQVRLKPSENCSVSVSGFDEKVYVYQLAPELKLVFSHDGHQRVEGLSSETTTSAHEWFPDIDNLIISSGDNGSIQSWIFEDNDENKTS